MKPRGGFDLPDELEPVMERARRLEWATLAWIAVTVVGVYLVKGGSQAMQAAWIEDLLSFVAPTAFLVAARFRHREPNERFPYGYHRSITIAFLAGSVALTLLGTFVLVDSLVTLIRAEHPTIGITTILGQAVWSGWLMIAVLFLSGVPLVVLGHAKLGPARQLHDKTLRADALMNRADWLTAAAGIVGILGIGIGWWWADATAGAVISVAVCRDGVVNLRRVVADLMDHRPCTIDGEISTVPQRVREAVLGLPWVAAVDVRLREEGHVFVGEVFVRARSTADLSAKLEHVRRAARAVDWRVHDLVIEVEELRG